MSDFTGMLARAQAKTGEKDWTAAAELWARVAAANPVNGDYWARLGEARFGAKDYQGARQAYEKALRLGVRYVEQPDDTPPLMPGEIAYRIACCEAAAGDREAAGAALQMALDRGMRDLVRVRSDELWEDLRADQRIRDMTGIIDADSMSRDDGWRYDLTFLAREIKRLAYAPFAIQTEAEFDQAVAELHRAIPGRTDAQIVVGMKKLIRHLDDGHAGVSWPKDDKEASRVLPVDFFLFAEGLYVIAAAPGCEHLLGAKVEKIGGLAIEEVMAALDPDTVAAPRPLHLRNRELPFWFEHLPADDLIYFQFNSVRDHPAETFAAFCDRLFGYIEASPASPDHQQAAEPPRCAVRHHRPAHVLGSAEHRHRHRTRDQRDLRR
jgi:hypothetical protein